MYAKLFPTTKMVIGLLLFPDNMTAKIRKVANHLKRYIKELDDETLGKLFEVLHRITLVLWRYFSINSYVRAPGVYQPLHKQT